MPPPRRFHAWNVGLWKTGTTSIAGIFSRYRAAHEFRARQTLQAVWRQLAGRTTRAELEAFLVRRDRLAGLEMDANGSHAFCVDLLARRFPGGRFVFTVRDPCSWIESFLNHAVRQRSPLPPWLRALGGRLLGLDESLPADLFRSRARAAWHLPRLLDGLLRFWAEQNLRILRALPPGRSLVLRTSEIGAGLPRLAALVGVPVRTLVAERAHLRRAPRPFPLLARIEPRVLRRAVRQHCGELLERLFPDWSVAEFLRRQA